VLGFDSVGSQTYHKTTRVALIPYYKKTSISKYEMLQIKIIESKDSLFFPSM